ncbi:MAG: hypothetical protein NZM37_13015 [Sandaracinaceae bacterium]|nr:hypothetical protein [Sandaracinaceae bacterium]
MDAGVDAAPEMDIGMVDVVLRDEMVDGEGQKGDAAFKDSALDIVDVGFSFVDGGDAVPLDSARAEASHDSLADAFRGDARFDDSMPQDAGGLLRDAVALPDAACGNAGQQCCDGGACVGGLVCRWLPGRPDEPGMQVCVPCGARRQPCCNSPPWCMPELTCQFGVCG